MSNLGMYQWFTTTAKKVGGPEKLILLIAAGGYGVFRIVEAGGKFTIKKIKKGIDGRSKKKLESYPICKVKEKYLVDDKVVVEVGDEIRVRAVDGEAVLIEIIGDKNNPYYIDLSILKKITDYKE